MGHEGTLAQRCLRSPWLRDAIMVAFEGSSTEEKNIQLSVATDEERENHFKNGHQPFRRDCRFCVLESGNQAPHRRRKNSAMTSAWTMGVDIVGPFPRCRDWATGKEMVRYALVATALAPDYIKEREGSSSDGKKKDEDAVMPNHEEDHPADPQVVDPEWGGVSKKRTIHLELRRETMRSKGWIMRKQRSEVPEEPVLKEMIERCTKPFNIRHVPQYGHSREQSAERQSEGILVQEGHCVVQGAPDPANYVGRCDDPAANGHTESEVNQLKRRVRLHLRAARQDISQWPQAIRYAAEERFRSQVQKLGVPILAMVPYQARVMVRAKRWFKQGALPSLFREGRILCASQMMHAGWVVKQDDGKVVHAREVVPSIAGERVRLRLEIEDRPGKRLYGKQAVPDELVVFPPTVDEDPPMPPPGEDPPGLDEEYEPSILARGDAPEGQGPSISRKCTGDWLYDVWQYHQEEVVNTTRRELRRGPTDADSGESREGYFRVCKGFEKDLNLTFEIWRHQENKSTDDCMCALKALQVEEGQVESQGAEEEQLQTDIPFHFIECA
eukprot:s2619_g6.t1